MAQYLDKAGLTTLWTKIKEQDYKPLYNLGYYDTITANSDGTYTITRQTGYIILDGVNAKATNVDYSHYISFNFASPNKEAFTLVASDFGVSTTTNWDSNDGFYFNPTNEYRLVLKATKQPIRTIGEWNAYLAQNNIYIQYKLATATTEKVEKNHYSLYNQDFILEHNKSEAERSANVFDINSVTIGYGYGYTETATDWVKAIDIPVKPNTTYTSSHPIARYAFNHGDIVVDYNKNTITTGNDTTTLSLFMYVGSYSGTPHDWFSNYMLNKGSIALPYQPYNQNKHITNYEADFLKTEHNRSVNLFNNPYNYSGTNNGVSINVVGNECILNGTSTAGYYNNLGSITLKAGTYSFNQVVLSGSINGNTDYVKFGLYKDDSLFPLLFEKGHYTYTLTQDTSISIVVWFGLDGITFNNCKLAYMLNEGSVALPYQPYEGKVVHEKDLGGYVTTDTQQTITGYKKHTSIGVDTINGATLGNAIVRQNASTGEVILGSTVRPLRLWGNQTRPSYSKNDGASYSEIALTSDIPTFKTINDNSIVGSGNISVTADSVFTEVTDVIDSFTINKNGTWLITCLGYNKIYASDNSTISFYGSALVSMTSVGSDPHICINGTAYACSSAITFVTSGIMQVYKKAN